MIFILYHAPCPDGAFAAMVASMYLERSGINPLDKRLVSWHPMKVFIKAGDQFPVYSVRDEDEVYFLDYTGDVDFVCLMALRAKRVIILDHHLTPKQAFDACPEQAKPLLAKMHLELDVHRSGATIALDYFSQRLCSETLSRRSKADSPDGGGPAEVEEPKADNHGKFTERGAGGSGDAEEAPPPDVAAVPDAGDCVERPLSKRQKRRHAERARGRGRGRSRGGGNGAALPPPAAADPTDTPAKTTLLVSAPAAGMVTGYTHLLGDEDAGRLLRLLRLIEDGDLFRFWMQDSKEFRAGFSALNLNFDITANPRLFAELRGLNVEKVVADGRRIVVEEERKMDDAMRHLFLVSVPEVPLRCLGVLASCPELRSSLGHKIAEESQRRGFDGMGVVAYSVPALEQKGLLKVSVRGVGGADTLAFTEKYGGGGHLLASSCNVQRTTFNGWRTELPQTSSATVVGAAA